MIDAPERLWATPLETVHNRPSWIDEIEVSHPESFGGFDQTGVEYVRADLVPQWQPIETAPKGGGEILFFGVEGCEMVFWCNYGDGSWLNASGKYPFNETPSHWMPLPEPPTPKP